MKKHLIPALSVTLALCSGAVHAADPAAAAALKKVDRASLLKHISTLASDEFEGRSPGSKGETMTINYLQQEFARLGLKPGNPDGSFFQKVPLLGMTSKPAFTYSAGGTSTTLKFPDEFVAWSTRTEKSVAVPPAELVFVGYGVDAPEFNWDDFKGMDLRGKVLVMLINDPAIPDPKDPSRLDPAMFDGSAMTYYGRWTYKYEIAAKLGAAGAIIVHETKPASYPWEVVRSSRARESFQVRRDGVDPNFPAVPGWVTHDVAKAMFKAGGKDFDELKKAALKRDFKPVPLGVSATLDVQNSWRDVASNNVVAKIEGSDPQLKDEYVVYTAHWDHFGIDESLPGPRTNQIYHGAQDNASGVAGLLELAKAYKALPKAPKRSILFVVTTAEERGLLGAQYYASHPLYPLAKTVLDINVDVLNVYGRTRDIEVTGHGKVSTDELLARLAKQQGRKVRAANAEHGGFYRSDQFEFAKRGVPVMFAGGGSDFIGKPKGYAKETSEDFTANHYHKVSDIVRPDWDLGGAVQDLQLLFQVGYLTAQGLHKPEWKAGAEFKATRDAMLKGASN